MIFDSSRCRGYGPRYPMRRSPMGREMINLTRAGFQRQMFPMQTVRPLGLVVLSWLVTLLVGGCGSILGGNSSVAVEFREAGKPVALSMHEYFAIRGNVKALLAEKNLALADVGFHSRMIAIVEVKAESLPAGRIITPVKIARVINNPKVRDLSPGMAGYWVSQGNEGAHPSITLTSNVNSYGTYWASDSTR